MTYRYHVESVKLDSENKQELALHNLKEADRTRDLNLFFGAAHYWMTAFQKSPQDLEKTLRSEKMDTHLMAMVPPPEFKFATDEFLLGFSCRSKEDAYKEIVALSGTYEKNFENLKTSKEALFNEDSTDSTNSQEKKQEQEPETDLEMSDFLLLFKGTGKLYFDGFCTSEEKVDSIKKRLEARGVTARYCMIGIGSQGGPLFGFVDTATGKFASKYGVLIHCPPNTDQSVAQIITLQ